MTGGELRGRALRAPRGHQVRPTADRVRESLFAALDDFEGSTVFDGFAGTGSLGIEALSRGAARAVFAERSSRVLAVLLENLESLALHERAVAQQGDVARVLRRLAAEQPLQRFDWVFLDPPYKSGHADTRRALEALREGDLLAAQGVVVLETSRHHPVDLPVGFLQFQERRYGDTVVVYLSVAASDGGDQVAPVDQRGRADDPATRR